MKVAILGSGMAGGCCAYLLAARGIAAEVRPSRRPAVPALLLSDAALGLIRGVFGNPGLFADRPRIDRRIVSWGGGEPVSMPHAAVTISEAELGAALFRAPAAAATADAEFTIHTAAPFPDGELRSFGERRAMAAEVRLLHADDRTACWAEALPDGWLFLIPAVSGIGWLLAVGSPLDELLEQSRHVAPRVAPTGLVSSAFETCPRLLTRLQGPDWLACGTAAIAFDPICGDGTAQSVREAILAAAVIGGMNAGGDREALLTHYESMLIAAMRRHLQLSARFYESGGGSDWWQAQLAALADGYRWCTARLAALPEPRFQLRDFRLVPREEMA